MNSIQFVSPCATPILRSMFKFLEKLVVKYGIRVKLIFNGTLGL